MAESRRSEASRERVPTAPAGGRKGSGLSARWHGVPIWVLGLGGGGGAFLLYRWYKGRQTASAATTSVATPASAATGTSGLGTGYTGMGTGGGGGGGGYGAANNGLLNQIAQQLASGNTPANQFSTPTTSSATTAAPAPSAPTTVSATASPVANPTPPLVPGANISTPTQTAAGEVASVPQREGATATGSGSKTGIAGTFNLPRGTVVFQPTAAVRRGNQVAYGIGQQSVASQARQLGGTVLSGNQLAARGWSGLTPGAKYLLR